MIFDRTQNDVEEALMLRKRIQDGQALTSSEIEQIERGTCTVIMLNRIEAKQEELAGKLNQYRYMNYIVNKTDWTGGDIFDYANYRRLLGNLDKLKRAYYIYQSTPKTPSYMYGWREANDIEKILVDIESMIDGMVLAFRECGNYECGE